MTRLVLAATAAVALVAAVVVIAGTSPDPAEAKLDGCGTERFAIFRREEPNWAYIGDRSSPASAPSPAAQWVDGVARAGGESPLGVHPTGVDDPITHDSYDVVVNVAPDPAFAFLLAGEEGARTGNFNGEEEELGRLHMEREEAGFPPAVWPENGDRVRALGSWVWDCEHFQNGGSKSEFHPVRALWVERGFSPRSSTGAAEAALWFSNAKTPAGIEADCAHQTKGDKPAFKTCLLAEPRTFAEGFSQSFLLPTPPRPSPGARFAIRVVDAGSTRGAPRPTFRRVAEGVRFTLAVPGSPGRLVRGAYRLLAGWTSVPARLRPRRYRVELRQLLVRRAMDPSCPAANPGCPFRVETTQPGQIARSPGEWVLYADIGGIWSRLAPTVLRVHDGQRVALRHRVDLYVPRGRPWRLFLFTRECDFGLPTFSDPKRAVSPCPSSSEFGHPTGDDKPGYVVATGRPGLHATNASLEDSTCPPVNEQGCYRLVWRVTEVRRKG